MLELHIPDFDLAQDFYSSLGFEVVWRREPKNDKGGYMVMKKDHSIINFFGGDEGVSNHSFFTRFPKDTPRGYGVEVMIPINGIEEFYEEFLKTHKDKVIKELNHKFTMPDFRATDPFGFYLRFVERYDWVNGRDKEGNRQNR